jgi:hypothetical protein
MSEYAWVGVIETVAPDDERPAEFCAAIGDAWST